MNIRETVYFDLVVTILSSLAITVGLVYIIHVITDYYNPEDLGLYLLSRRYVGFLAPLILLGGSISIPRYVAGSASVKDGVNFAFNTLIITVVFLGIMFLLVALFTQWANEMLYAGGADDYFLYASLVFLGGLVVKTIVVAYYRGKIKVLETNLVNVIAGALVPVLVIWYCARNILPIGEFLLYAGLLSIVVTIPFWIRNITIFHYSKSKIVSLTLYGMPRAIDGLSHQGVFLCGPLVIQYFYGLKAASIFITGQIVLKIIATLFRPIGTVILPRTVVKRNNIVSLRSSIDNIIGIVIYFGFYVSLFIIVLVPAIVSVWLGDKYIEAIPIIRILTIGIIPYLLFIMLKSIIDGAVDKPVSTIGLLCATIISCILTLFSSLMGYDMLITVSCNMIGFIFIGVVVTHRCVNYLGASNQHWYTALKVSLFNVILWSVTYWILGSMEDLSLYQWILKLIILFINFLLYILFIFWMDDPWIRFIKKRLRETK